MFGVPSAFAEAPLYAPTATEPPAAADTAVRLAQRSDDDEDRKRKGKPSRDKDRKDDNGRKESKGGKDGGDRSADKARQKAQQQDEQDKQNAFKKKMEAEAAREKAAKEKRREAEQAKDKASNKKKQDADAARQDAMKYIRRQSEEAKEKSLKQKQEAEAREKAAKERQRRAEEAKEKARKQEAEAAREKAAKEKRLQDQQAREKALERKQDAARKDRDTRKPTKFDRAKADQEFERARKEAQQKSGSGSNERWRAESARKFEDVRKGRKTREVGSRDVIIEPDKRVIVRDNNRTFIRHDESKRVARKGREVRRERRKDGTWLVITAGLAGALIHSIMDDDGRVIRRSRRDRDGREYVLFDDRRYYRGRPQHAGPDDYDYYHEAYIDLPPPVIRIPRDRYIVEYDRASPDDLYDALNAPPVEDLGRGYSLDEVRQNYRILERMRRVDLNAVNFEFASWDVGPDQYPKLERIARAMQRILDRSPGELFLIEGHTDAVGNEIDNLSLSDRRAETVANVLSDEFGIPPENLATQGYGEEYLKELTEGPSWVNRRVAVRRITPLLSREGWNDPS